LKRENWQDIDANNMQDMTITVNAEFALEQVMKAHRGSRL
jgi:hypothetical protein